MKRLLDKYISENYDELLRCAKAKKLYFKSSIDVETLINNAYLYVHYKLPLDEGDIPKYLKNYIDTELRYPRSQTNRKNKLNSVTYEYTDDLRDFNEFSKQVDQDHFEHSLDEFYKSLSRENQIIYRVMHDKGIITVEGLSNHFNIPKSTIYQYKTEIHERLKQHINKYHED